MAEETVKIEIDGEKFEVWGEYDPGQKGTRDQEYIPESFEIDYVFKDGKLPNAAWNDFIVLYFQKNYGAEILEALHEKWENDSIDLKSTRRGM